MYLPVRGCKLQIQQSVLGHKYTLISSEAGGGKSTLVPQYLMHHFKKVIVTNPRVISAITLAQYVAEDMGVELGEAVGYRTGYYKCASKDTAIEYCTDGLQLIRAIFSEDREVQKVLIIDEVHEWTNQTEGLVAWCKLVANEWNTKVVIMSATMETQKIAEYLGQDTSIINVPGKTYNVIAERRHKWEFEKTIREEIDKGHNILAFVATKNQVREMVEKLQGEKAEILPLHGELEYQDQRKCFYTYPRPKVVISTPIAQTSVTIPGIDTVVDTGTAIIPEARHGVMYYEEQNISQADIRQRMKRAGRTKDGWYFLCSEVSFKERPEYPVPEIQRSFLDQTVLQFASIGVDAEKMEFFHQPEPEAIREAKKKLKIIGCLTDDGEVTEIGHKVAKIPMPTDKARMIVEAEKYSVTEQVITICAIIEMGGLLQKSKKIGLGKYETFTDESESDFLAELAVWNRLNDMQNIYFKSLGINGRSYREAKKHLERLYAAVDGIIEISSNYDRDAIIKSCMAGMTDIYVKSNYEDYVYIGTEGDKRKLDIRSCVNGNWDKEFLVGRPITVPGVDRYGYKTTFNLLTFVSIAPKEFVLERLADYIETDTEVSYDAENDTVAVVKRKYYKGHEITEERYFDSNHESYEELKTRYEEKERNKRESAMILEQAQRAQEERIRQAEEAERQRAQRIAAKQQYVTVEGQQFKVNYDMFEKPYIGMAAMYVYRIKQDKVTLDDGEEVTIREIYTRLEGNSISKLRKALDAKTVTKFKTILKRQCEGVYFSDISSLIRHSDMICEYQETVNDYGEKVTFDPIYVCARLKKEGACLVLESSKEQADADTQKTLEYLFDEEMKAKYPERSFSRQAGKKRKVLTDSEKKAKLNFDSFVKECRCGLTIGDVAVWLDLIEEHYQELMAGLDK